MMFKNLLSSAIVAAGIFFLVRGAFAQAPTPAYGDYGSVTSGNWSSAGNWKAWTGSAFDSTVTGAPSSSKQVFILSGTTVTYDNPSQNCKNLVVQSGATFKSDSTLPCPTGSLMALKINGPTVWVDGNLGGGPNDALVIETKHNGTITLSGTGKVNVAQVRPNSGQTGTLEFVFGMNANVNYAGEDGSGGAGIYTQRGTQTSSTITVSAGDTVNFANKCNFMINSTAGLNGLMNTVLNVDGVVNDSGTVVLADSSTATAALNIGSAGRLIVRGSSLIDSLDGGNAAMITVDGIYEHSLDGGIIPTATWNAGSTCLVTGSKTLGPTNANQNFYNLTVDCPGLMQPSYPCHFDMQNNTIEGNLTFHGTNGKFFALTGYEISGSPKTITINGDFIMDGSSDSVAVDDYSSSHIVETVNLVIKGNMSVNGFFAMTYGSALNFINLYLHGNLAIQPNVSFCSHSKTQDSLFFAGTGIQAYLAGQGGAANRSHINFVVMSGATVDADTSQFEGGSSTFALSPGATLKTGHPAGINGNLVLGGGTILSEDANYVFSGTSPQITGSLMPDTLKNLTIDNAAGVTPDTGITVNGTLLINGLLVNQKGIAADTVIVNGTYQHDFNGGAIPTASWNTGSTCLLTGTTTIAPTNVNQNFYNLTVDCPGLLQPSYPCHFDMSNNTIQGNLTFHSTNGKFFALTGYEVPGSPKTITVNGNFSLDSTSDSVAVDDYSSSHPLESVNMVVKGNISVAGFLALTYGSSLNLINLTLYGDLTLQAGSSLCSHSKTKDSLFFAGPGVQAFVAGPGGGAANRGHVNFAVLSGSTLDMDTSAFEGSSSSFAVASGATVKTGHPAGLNGNLTLGGGTSLNTGANFVYDGTAVQVTGTMLPDTLNNLTIDDSLGVVLTKATLVNGVLTLKAGLFNNTFPLTLGPHGSVVYAGGKLLIPLSLRLVTIAEARKDDNHDLIPDYSVTGDTLEIVGIITSPNLQGSNTAYFVQDATAGIEVFQYGLPPTTYTMGDSVFVIGVVAQYHGLDEFEPLVLDTAHFRILKHNATMQKPVHLTLHQYLANAETYEGTLFEIDTLYKASGTWPAASKGASIYLTDETRADTAQMYINASTNIAGTVEPKYPVNVVGIGSQYSSGKTLDNGYEIVPRDSTDIVHVEIVGINDIANNIPKEFYLSQNYPNPFNPSTTITFGLPKASNVQIMVYNILGQRVAVLVDGKMNAGNHAVMFNGDRLSSGVYFYLMRAGEKIFKQKMLLLK